MSDFDKIINERLNEKAQFGGLEENWQKLAARLGPPGSPAPAPGGGFWRWLLGGAAAAAVLGFGVWSVARMARLEEANAALQTGIAALKTAPQMPAAVPVDTVFSTRVIVRTDTIFRKIHVLPEVQDAPVFSEAKSGQQVFGKTENALAPTFGPEKTPGKILTQNPAARVKNRLGENPKIETANPSSAAVGTPANSPVSENWAEKGVGADANNGQNEAGNLVSEKPRGFSDTKFDSIPAPENQVQLFDNQSKTLVSDTSAQALQPLAETPVPAENPSEKIPGETSGTFSATETAPSQTLAADSPEAPAPAKNPAPEIPNPTSFDASAGAVPRQKRAAIRLRDFSVGAHFTAGNSFVKDVSALTGGGLSAEIGIAKNVRFSASLDRMTLNYAGNPRAARLNLPDAPAQGPLTRPFSRVEVTQRRQNLGLRVQYLFPVTGAFQPFVSAGYAWQRVASQDAKFIITNPLTGAVERTLPGRAGRQVFGSNWTAGFGVERMGRRVGGGLSAEFQNSVGKKTLSVPLLRAGVKVKIL